MSNQSPAQLLLARTPASVSAAQTSAHVSSRPRHAASSSVSVQPSPIHVNGPLRINACFSSTARNPGTVKVSVEDAIFYVHRDVMSFASSFWEAILDPAGGWLETSSDAPTSFVGGANDIGLSRRRWSRQIPLSRQQSRASQDEPHNDTNETTEVLGDDPAIAFDSLHDPSDSQYPTDQQTGDDHADVETATVATSLAEELVELKIDVTGGSKGSEEQEMVGVKSGYEDYRKKVEARVTLREEKAAAFQDLLCFVYPHLECVIHWNNVADLLTMAQKFDMPLLRRHCIAFLLTSVAGKPITAMKVAEDHLLLDLYREASRFLLDSWSVWDQAELAVLSSNTLLKLEKRRNWFLERLLKLGLINTQRDYVCCQGCPDPQGCARMLDEKWKSAWSSAFRFGSPTPSNIWRSLRMLEPSLSSPALHLPHTSCQNHAKAWVADLFDRMFSLGVPTQRSFTVSSAASRGPLPDPASNKRYFLYVDWKS